MRVNADELAGCLQCGPAGLACGFSRCGKTAVEARALVGPGGRGGSPAASRSGDRELVVRAWEHSSAFASSGPFSVGLYRQWRKINKSVLAYHAPYG